MQSRPALRIADSLVLSAAICAYAATTATTHAQQFPAKPVRYGVAFAAGDSPDVHQRLNDLVIDVATQSRDEFTAFMRSEAARWAKVVKDAGLPPQ